VPARASSLLHLSDVHFGPKHLPELAAAAAECARARRPDVVVLSGDLTQRAKPAQFRAARAWIDALGLPVVFAPGNHDVPLWRIWERLFAPFGAWRRWLAPELVRHHTSEALAVVAVNTAHPWTTKHGRLSRRAVAELDRQLAAAPPDAARVVVAHHPLARVPELGAEPPARGGRQALAVCRARGVDLILSGHLHHGFVAAASPAGGPPWLVHAGTSTSSRGRGREVGRNSLNWIEIGAESQAVARWFWEPSRGAWSEADRIELPRSAPRPPSGAADIIRA
jgi:3',5'-cyclic AMP phosphodiesterase CpdA